MHDWTVTVVSYICILSKDLITKVTMHCDECLSSRHFEEWVNSLIIRYLINFYKIIYIEIMHRSHIHSLMLSMSRLHQGGSCINNTPPLLLLLLYILSSLKSYNNLRLVLLEISRLYNLCGGRGIRGSGSINTNHSKTLII